MSTEQSPTNHVTTTAPKPQENKGDAQPLIRVVALIDGFNLYHALDWYEDGLTEAENKRFQKYKWLSLTTLVSRFVRSKSEILKDVYYFTTYPKWDEEKKRRHTWYVMTQVNEGVKVVFGDFKQKSVTCKGTCKVKFNVWEEKQTDVNIATKLVELAGAKEEITFDKAILLSGDSDQVPAIKLVKKLYPEKVIGSLIPIGRRADEIKQAADVHFKMTEEHLKASQLPDKVHIKSQNVYIQKPEHYK